MTDYDIMIRPAQLPDLDQIVVIEQQSFLTPWSADLLRQEIENPDSALLVAVASDKVLGFGGFLQICEEAHVMNLAVDPRKRNRGIGGMILAQLIRDAIKRGIDDMTLEVRVSNLSAIHLYEIYGFVPVGIRKKYYNDNMEDALIMWKYHMSEENE